MSISGSQQFPRIDRCISNLYPKYLTNFTLIKPNDTKYDGDDKSSIENFKTLFIYSLDIQVQSFLEYVLHNTSIYEFPVVMIWIEKNSICEASPPADEKCLKAEDGEDGKYYFETCKNRDVIHTSDNVLEILNNLEQYELLTPNYFKRSMAWILHNISRSNRINWIIYCSCEEESSKLNNRLKVHSLVDARDYNYNWFPAKIVDIKVDHYKVHFLNYASNLDEWISIDDKRLAPLGSHSHEYHRIKKLLAHSSSIQPRPNSNSEINYLTRSTRYSIQPSKTIGFYSDTNTRYNGFSRLKDSNHNSSPVVLGAIGLLNIGNTCFLNAGLQCLFHCKYFDSYFGCDGKDKEGDNEMEIRHNSKYIRDINFKNPLGTKGQVVKVFAELYQYYWSTTSSPINPEKFQHILKLNNALFEEIYQLHVQQDVAEFIHMVLDTLHEDLKLEPNQNDNEIINECNPNNGNSNSFINKHFSGFTRSILSCQACHHESVRFESYLNLGIPLVNNRCNVMTFNIHFSILPYLRCFIFIQANIDDSIENFMDRIVSLLKSKFPFQKIPPGYIHLNPSNFELLYSSGNAFNLMIPKSIQIKELISIMEAQVVKSISMYKLDLYYSNYVFDIRGSQIKDEEINANKNQGVVDLDSPQNHLCHAIGLPIHFHDYSNFCVFSQLIFITTKLLLFEDNCITYSLGVKKLSQILEQSFTKWCINGSNLNVSIRETKSINACFAEKLAKYASAFH